MGGQDWPSLCCLLRVSCLSPRRALTTALASMHFADKERGSRRASRFPRSPQGHQRPCSIALGRPTHPLGHETSAHVRRGRLPVAVTRDNAHMHVCSLRSAPGKLAASHGYILPSSGSQEPFSEGAGGAQGEGVLWGNRLFLQGHWEPYQGRLVNPMLLPH